MIRMLLGMDAKMAQYVRGKAFVDAVVLEVGMEQFNTIWTGPETLPLLDEIDDPDAWIDTRSGLTVLPESRPLLGCRTGAVRAWLAAMHEPRRRGASSPLSGRGRFARVDRGSCRGSTVVRRGGRRPRLQEGSDGVADRPPARRSTLGCAAADGTTSTYPDPVGPKPRRAGAVRRSATLPATDAPGAARTHTRRSGRDRPARTRPAGRAGVRCGHGRMRRAVGPAAARGAARRRPGRHAPNWAMTPWDDPHNADPEFTRVRSAHEVLPLLEDVLGGGVAAALARTAEQLRDDGEVLDTLADASVRGRRRRGPRRGRLLEARHRAPRRRVLRRWLLAFGGARL